MFLADALAVRDGNLEALSRWPQYMAYFEPITLLAGIAGQTERIRPRCDGDHQLQRAVNVATNSPRSITSAPAVPAGTW